MENRRRPSMPWEALFATVAALAGPAVTGCGGEDASPFAPATVTRGATVHATVHAGTAAPLYVQAEPDAVCLLHMGGGSDAGLELLADGRGVVSFETTVPAGPVARQALECVGPAGARAVHAIELTVVSDREPLASDTAHLADLPPQGTIVPPLDAAAAVSLDGAELLRRGYPVRPDAKTAPALYQRWREAVSAPTIQLDGRTVTRPGRHAATSQITEHNWSGFIVDEFTNYPNQNQIWEQVSGEWPVPAVTAPTNVTRDYWSAMWVGLGGFTSTPLAQTGSNQDVSCNATTGMCSAGYSAFAEFFPNPEQTFSNLQVSPGHVLIAGVQMVDASGAANRFGPNALLVVTDYGYTPARTVLTTITKPAGSTWVGESAEWIMERPRIFNDSNTYLPKYAATTMKYTFAAVCDKTDTLQRKGCYTMTYGNAAVSTFQALMATGTSNLAGVISGVMNSTGQQMTFYWLNYH